MPNESILRQRIKALACNAEVAAQPDAAAERTERREVHMSRAKRDRQHKVLPLGRPKGVNDLLDAWHMKPVVPALMGLKVIKRSPP